MRRLVLAVAAIAALAAGSARAQSSFPTPQGNANAPGFVVMCPTGANAYVPCGAAGARPLPSVLLNTPNVVPQQPQVVTAIATGTTGAVTATFTLVPGKTLYICGVDVSTIGGTAESSPVTITGLLGGTFTYQLPVNATGGQIPLSRTYTPCIPAASPSTAIAVVTTAASGATAVDVQAWGVAQ
jgi:hypothetical protein